MEMEILLRDGQIRMYARYWKTYIRETYFLEELGKGRWSTIKESRRSLLTRYIEALSLRCDWGDIRVKAFEVLAGFFRDDENFTITPFLIDDTIPVLFEKEVIIVGKGKDIKTAACGNKKPPKKQPKK